jgi:hypothetical protein
VILIFSTEEDLWQELIFWGIFLLLALLCGVAGIIEAFRRNRKRALLRSGMASGVALLFLLHLFARLLSARSHGRELVEFAGVASCGLLPLAAGCWALLLAFLVPEKHHGERPSAASRQRTS